MIWRSFGNPWLSILIILCVAVSPQNSLYLAPSPVVPPSPSSPFQLVHPLPTSVRLSACHPRVMPLSQLLGALLTLQHSMFAQSFGSRIRGWIVNYSRSFCAPQPTPPPIPAPDLLLTHLHGDGAGICFLSCIRCQLAPSSLPATTSPPLLFIFSPFECPIKKQLEGVTWSGSFVSCWAKHGCHWRFEKALGGKLGGLMGRKVNTAMISLHTHKWSKLMHTQTYKL